MLGVCEKMHGAVIVLMLEWGVVIGEQAIVGANAGVYKDVVPKNIVGGNPAKLIKERER